MNASTGTGAIILAIGVKCTILGAERGAGNNNTFFFKSIIKCLDTLNENDLNHPSNAPTLSNDNNILKVQQHAHGFYQPEDVIMF